MPRFAAWWDQGEKISVPIQLAFTGLSVFLASLAMHFLGQGSAGAFSLTAGVAFALLVRFGTGVAPAIFAGEVLASAMSTSSPLLVLIEGAALILAIIPAALPVRKVPVFRVDRPRDAALNLLFLLLISFPAAAGLRSLLHSPEYRFLFWLEEYLQNASGLIVIGLPLIFWRRSSDRTIPEGQRLEAVMAAAFLFSSSFLVFHGVLSVVVRERMIAYVPVFAVLWLSLRFNVLAASASLLFLITIAWIETVSGRGPFASSPDALPILRIYLDTLSVGVFFILLLKRRYGNEAAARIRSDFHFRIMAERSRDLVFRFHRSHRPSLEFLSPVVYEMTGYRPEDFYDDPMLLLRLCHPDDRPLLQYIQNTDESEMTTEIRLRHRHGDYRWIECHQVSLTDESGAITAIEGTARDISERKRAEENILHLNRLLLSLREIGQLLTRVREVDILFQEICNILVRNRGYRLVWIGIEKADCVQPVALAGDLKALPDDIAFSPSRTETTISLPLNFEERHFGWMNVSLDEGHFIDREERELLNEMGEDLAYGLFNIEMENERRQAVAALKKSEEEYRLLVEEAAEGILVVNTEGIITEANPFGCRMFGSSREDIIGQPLKAFLPEEERDSLQFRTGLMKRGQSFNMERRILRNDGTTVEVEVNISVLPDGSFQGLVRDISQRKRAEREIEQLAFFDSLTGLPNRRLLQDHLARDFAFMRRKKRFSGLLFLDLDHFKRINDSFGHRTGDEILRQVADRLRSELRTEDTVARLGGDEFIILLFDLASDPDAAAVQARGVAEKLLGALAPPFTITSSQIFITPSVGITIFPRKGQSIDDILREADTAMYRSKTDGRNSFRFFQPEMQTAAEIRVAMEMEMRLAIDRNEFILYYQPQLEAGGSLCGMEALLRWRHPEKGILSPGKFISVAEETGLILPLGERLLELACLQLRGWSDRSISPPTLSVNISARQFRQDNFVSTVQQIIEGAGVSPERLVFEITESVFMERIDESIEKMQELRSYGIRFSIDDFGTGYSSLTYLKRLPLNEIKIDRTFVQDSSESDFSRAVIRTILTIAHHLDMTVVAEGVETEAQRHLLETLGCRRFQGFLYGKPAPAEIHTELLAGMQI